MSRYETYLRKIAGEDVDISNMPEPSDRYEYYLRQIALNGGVDPEVIAQAVSDWLDDHPEATTTVEDGSITKAKLDSNLQGTVDDVDELKSAISNIETATANDVGKALSPKTVTNGKVTEWQYKVIGGGGGGAVDDVQIAGTSIVDGSGVANIPKAASDTFGVTKPSSGLTVNSSGEMYISKATSTQVKQGTAQYNPLTPSVEHEAAFYGIAKAAGDSTQSSSSNAVGTYTENAKSAIASMLSAPETVSGTTPTIAAKAGVQYICGEVSTIDFTPSATGVCDVVFTSGSTPAVLTVPNAVKFPSWFDPTSLDANTTYEINVLNGVYGAVMAWA